MFSRVSFAVGDFAKNSYFSTENILTFLEVNKCFIQIEATKKIVDKITKR